MVSYVEYDGLFYLNINIWSGFKIVLTVCVMYICCNSMWLCSESHKRSIAKHKHGKQFHKSKYERTQAKWIT